MMEFYFYVFQIPHPFRTVCAYQQNPFQENEKLSIDDADIDISECTNYESLKGEFFCQFMTKKVAFYVFEWKTTVPASSVKEVLIPTIPCPIESFFMLIMMHQSYLLHVHVCPRPMVCA